MSQIGALVASTSTVFNLDFLPERFLIGTADVAFPLSQLSVVTAGTQVMLVTSSARIQALAKFDQGATLGTDILVPMWLRMAFGRINKNTTINCTNSGATTPAVFASSTGLGSVARQATEQSINASANAAFSNFEALFYDPTNVLRVQLIWENDFIDEYSVPEIDALFSAYNVADADNRLAGLSCIAGSSGAGNIKQATIFNGSGGATVVLRTNYAQL